MSLKHLTVCSFKNIFKYICVCLTVIFSRGGLKSFYVLCKSNQIWSGKYNKTKMLWKIGAFLVLGKLHPSFRLTYGSTAYISNPKLFENLKIVLLKKSLCEKKKKWEIGFYLFKQISILEGIFCLYVINLYHEVAKLEDTHCQNSPKVNTYTLLPWKISANLLIIKWVLIECLGGCSYFYSPGPHYYVH